MKNQIKIILGIFTAMTVLIVSQALEAQSVAEIFKKADTVGLTSSSKMEVSQTIITPSGDKRTFKMISYSSGGTDKGLTEYFSPKQVMGMKILTLNDGDDIWTYFPRTNRTRKIASSARNRKVQGSDFTYDDMASGKMSTNWKGKLLGTEKINGHACYKIEITPTKSGPKSYSKAITWINKSNYTTLKIEYWDLDGEKIKRLDISDYKKVEGVLIPFKYTMTSLLDGGKTMMKLTKVAVNVKLPSGLFSESSLGK